MLNVDSLRKIRVQAIIAIEYSYLRLSSIMGKITIKPTLNNDQIPNIRAYCTNYFSAKAACGDINTYGMCGLKTY